MAKVLEDIEKDISVLPAPLGVFLTDASTVDKIKKITDEFHLDEMERKEIEKIIASVVSGELDLYDIAVEISDELGLEMSVAMDMNGKLYEDLLFNLEEEISAQRAAHQASAASRSEKQEQEIDVGKIKAEKESSLMLIGKAIKKFNLFSGDEAAQKKFSEIAETFSSNVRTKSQLKSVLTKPAADGGLDMAHELADQVADFLASYSRLQPVIARNEVKKKNSEPQKEKIPPPTTPLIAPLRSKSYAGQAIGEKAPFRPAPPKIKIEVEPVPIISKKNEATFAAEEKEAAAKKAKIEKMRKEAPKLLSVTEGVRNALAELNYTFPSSELQERLRQIIDARVRNVRTSVQTFEKLTQNAADGGMGFNKEEADKVSLVLNKYLEMKNKDIYGSKLAEIKQAQEEEKHKNAERALAAEEVEKKRLDERFTKLTGKKIPFSSPLEKGEKKGDLTPSPSSEKITNHKSQIINNSQIINQKSKIPPPPPPPPVLEDIKFTPKLAGPVEEIARLTLEDSRRLSADPKEAMMKIKDKLALLRGESFKKYQAGLDAWKKSPLYGEYLKIINKSVFDGVPLEKAISESGTLTRGEIDAIINSRIGD